MTDISDLLDEIDIPYEKRDLIREEISKKVSKMIFEDKILQGSEWIVEYDSIRQINFNLFGDYDKQREIIDALAEFTELDIYFHDPWEGGQSRISTLTKNCWMHGDVFPVIIFTSFAGKKEIKELVDAAGITLILDGLDDKIDKAKRKYDWEVDQKKKWEF